MTFENRSQMNFGKTVLIEYVVAMGIGDKCTEKFCLFKMVTI